jgi:hypothetical protein
MIVRGRRLTPGVCDQFLQLVAVWETGAGLASRGSHLLLTVSVYLGLNRQSRTGEVPTSYRPLTANSGLPTM